MRKLRLRKVQQLAQGHTAREWPSWDPIPGLPDSEVWLFMLSIMIVRFIHALVGLSSLFFSIVEWYGLRTPPSVYLFSLWVTFGTSVSLL